MDGLREHGASDHDHGDEHGIDVYGQNGEEVIELEPYPGEQEIDVDTHPERRLPLTKLYIREVDECRIQQWTEDARPRATFEIQVSQVGSHVRGAAKLLIVRLVVPHHGAGDRALQSGGEE